MNFSDYEVKKDATFKNTYILFKKFIHFLKVALNTLDFAFQSNYSSNWLNRVRLKFKKLMIYVITLKNQIFTIPICRVLQIPKK